MGAFGPSVVLSVAVLLAASVFRENRIVAGSAERRRGGKRGVGAAEPSDLRTAIGSAVALNSFKVSPRNEPSVRLQAAVRFAPLDYESVAGEIAGHFRNREVISIDLSNMESTEAVRLVDFCSGMAAMCSGWVLPVTNTVLVVTPPS